MCFWVWQYPGLCQKELSPLLMGSDHPCSALVRPCQFWVLQYKTNINELKWVPQKASHSLWTGAPALEHEVEAVGLVQTGEAAVLRGVKSQNNHRCIECFGSEGTFLVQPPCDELGHHSRIIKVGKVLQGHRVLESCWSEPCTIWLNISMGGASITSLQNLF